jgi:hypothetical protein
MDAMSVQVASGPVVVLGGAWVGVAGEDLGVAERDAGIECVGDRGVTQRVWADVPRDASDLRDPGNHAVGVAAVDRPTRDRAQDQQSGCALVAAGFQTRNTDTVSGIVAGLLPFAQQVQHPMVAEALCVVLDPHRGSF